MVECLNREKDVIERLSKPKRAPRLPSANQILATNSYGDVQMFGTREPVSIDTVHTHLPVQKKNPKSILEQYK